LIFTIENKPIQADLDEILDAIQNTPNVEFVDFDYESAMRLRDLSMIPEMHDRMIVATALEYQAVLITLDESITTSGVVDVIW
jgi:PIN domain nuclease of toxin-antitoxin system